MHKLRITPILARVCALTAAALVAAAVWVPVAWAETLDARIIGPDDPLYYTTEVDQVADAATEALDETLLPLDAAAVLPAPALLAQTTERAEPLRASGRDALRIAIDPGHGGRDPGARANGLEEKELNLKIATYLRDILDGYYGVQTFMTRTDDTFVELSDRTTMSARWGADTFVSVHINSTAGATGALAIVPNDSNYQAANRDEARGLAGSILAQIKAQTGLNNRGFLIRNGAGTYPDGYAADYYAVINGSRRLGMVGTLIEHGFIDGAPLDVALLSSEEGLQKLAQADADGIVAYYGLQRTGAPRTTVTAIGPGVATLEWSAVEDATSYTVYASTDGGANWQVLEDGTTQTTFTATGLEVGTTYTFLVRALLNGTFSAFSATDYATVNLVPAPAVAVDGTGDGSVTLSWEPVEDATRYAIAEKLSEGSYKTFTLNCTDTTYTISNLRNGVRHRFVVQANIAGKWSPLTQTYLVDATPQGTEKPTAAVESTGMHSATLTWNAVPGATCYAVASRNVDGSYTTYTYEATGTRYQVTDLRNDRTYQFLVQAGFGAGEWSAFSTADLVAGTTLHDPTAAGMFTDVGYGAWFNAPITAALAAHYMQGYTGTEHFGPLDSLTRGQAAVVLYNMAGGRYGKGTATAAGFSDVRASAFYAEAVAWAHKQGVVNGHNGAFRPNDNVTRQEFAQMLANYAAMRGAATSVNTQAMLARISDPASVDAWARPAVAWAISANVMGSQGWVHGQDTISRAEVAQMIVNYQPNAL